MQNRYVEKIGFGILFVTLFYFIGALIYELVSKQATIFHIVLLVVQIFLVAFVLVRKIRYKRKSCPHCGIELPKWRIPQDNYERFIGGWTCSNCGIKLTWDLKERV